MEYLHSICFALYGKAAEAAAYLVMNEVPFKVSFHEHRCYLDLTMSNELKAFMLKAFPEGVHNV